MFCRNCGGEVPPQAVFCPRCGISILTGLSFCPNCGAQVGSQADVCLKCGARLPKPETHRVSTKSRLATTLLALFLGAFGAHRFYVGKVGTAIVMLMLGLVGFLILLTIWLSPIGLAFMVAVGIWAFVDFILSLVGRFEDDSGLTIEKW